MGILCMCMLVLGVVVRILCMIMGVLDVGMRRDLRRRQRHRLRPACLLHHVKISVAAVEPNQHAASGKGAPGSIPEQGVWVCGDNGNEHRPYGECLACPRGSERPVGTEEGAPTGER